MSDSGDDPCERDARRALGARHGECLFTAIDAEEASATRTCPRQAVRSSICVAYADTSRNTIYGLLTNRALWITLISASRDKTRFNARTTCRLGS